MEQKQVERDFMQLQKHLQQQERLHQISAARASGNKSSEIQTGTAAQQRHHQSANTSFRVSSVKRPPKGQADRHGNRYVDHGLVSVAPK